MLASDVESLSVGEDALVVVAGTPFRRLRRRLRESWVPERLRLVLGHCRADVAVAVCCRKAGSHQLDHRFLTKSGQDGQRTV